MAQPYYIPPDPYGDIDNANYGIWRNLGQVVDQQGDSVPSISWYTTGALPRAYFHKNGVFSLVLATRDTVAGVDTLRRLDVTCAGPNANYPNPVAQQLRDHYANFYLPQCGPGGATNVKAYRRVLYPEVYPDIDMHIYSGKHGQKLAFVVKPGGDPKDIQLWFQGQDSMDVDIYGNLQLMIAGQWVVLPEAVAFQTDSLGTIIPVNWTAEFQAYNSVGKAFLEFAAYDHTKPLVFVIGPPPALGLNIYDTPGLCWSTFYGGEAYDFPKDVQLDNAGNVYVAGRTESSWDNFPNAPGTNTNATGASVATLTKFNPDHELEWTIYHGGNGGLGSETTAAALAVKNTGDGPRLYMVGTTDADDFFTQEEIGAYNDLTNSNSTNKGFVVRYDDDGLLEWSTYIGDQDVQVHGIDVHTNGWFAIAGITKGSLPLDNFPPDLGTYQFDTYHGADDAFVAVFNATDNVSWSAYYGGTNIEFFATVSWAENDVVLAGTTLSDGLPMVGSAPNFQESFHGQRDVFLARFNQSGLLNWSTYFGGTGMDELAPKGLTALKDIYLTGSTGTLSTPVAGPGWSDLISAPAPQRNGFIARFDGTSLAPEWISYLGQGVLPNHRTWCIDVSQDVGNPITVSGFTGDATLPVAPGLGYYYQPTMVADFNNVEDGFVMRFDDAQNLQWATYFGGQAGGLIDPQNITAVRTAGGATYAVGYTSQTTGWVPQSIPLDGIVDDPMFFSPLYNYAGLTGDFTDGVVTKFCNEGTTGLADQERSSTTLQVAWSPHGELTLLGLSDGAHQLKVYDAQGRLVLQQAVRSNAGRSEAVLLRDRSAALYLLVVDNQCTGRLVPIR